MAAALLAVGVVGGCASTEDEEVRKLRARSTYEQGLGNLAESRVALGMAGLKEAVQLDPRNATYRNALGVVYLDMRRPAEAQAEFQKATELEPGFAEAHHNLGLAFAEQKRYEQAIAAYRRALSLPMYATPEIAYYNLGNAYLGLNQPRDAEDAFRAAVQINPKLTGAYYQLGMILTQGGRRDEAKAAFRAARDLEPASPFGRAAGEALKTLGEGG
jgi:Tfp pilus assembly protein PilF